MYFFFNYGLVYFLINVYSDLSQTALKYFKNAEVNIDNVLIMIGDFNIRDNGWDPNFLYHSIYRDTCIDITDSFHLELSEPTNYVLTRYLDNQHNLNLIINLMFLRPNSPELNNYSIHLDLCFTSDHAPLTINVTIFKEYI